MTKPREKTREELTAEIEDGRLSERGWELAPQQRLHDQSPAVPAKQYSTVYDPRSSQATLPLCLLFHVRLHSSLLPSCGIRLRDPC